MRHFTPVFMVTQCYRFLGCIQCCRTFIVDFSKGLWGTNILLRMTQMKEHKHKRGSLKKIQWAPSRKI